jgi:Flp pilus assembly secretin CpaC
MWPDYLAGVIAMERKSPDQALEHFATAALAEPDNAFAFEGLAAAAYTIGNLSLAEDAAKRALHLAPDSTIAWRTLALTVAAQGNTLELNDVLKSTPTQMTNAQSSWIKARTQNLLRTASVDIAKQESLSSEAPAVSSGDQQSNIDATNPTQLTIDVTLILSDKRNTQKTGVNLLDGLQGTFGYSRPQTQTFNQQTGSPENSSSTRTITRTISIPDVTYNLNVFNRGDRYYEAVARPSLTGFVGETSKFFIGDQLNVNVAGIQSAQIEKIDVGISMTIVPSEIRGDGAKFQLEVDRSFLSDTNAGSFTQAIGTFKQTVSATADVKFGETLILSGLSESVGDSGESKTPLLGDIPILNTFFSNKSNVKRARSAIILVTPSLPTAIAKTVNYGPATNRLLELWDSVIEPKVGPEKRIKNISRGQSFTRSAYGDTPLRGLDDQQLHQALFNNINQLSSI